MGPPSRGALGDLAALLDVLPLLDQEEVSVVQPESQAPPKPPAAGKPVALVTGGSRGIGRSICLELARIGYKVAINFTASQGAAAQTQALAGPQGNTFLCKADVGVAADRERMVDEVLAHWGQIDLL